MTITLDIINSRREEVNKQMKQAESTINACQGALQILNDLENVIKAPEAVEDKKQKNK
jgi:hypothetical protein